MNSYILALIGGVLIGFSSSLLLGGIGRIAGISGILSSSLGLPKKEHFWRYSFVIGLLFGGLIMNFFYPSYFDYKINESVIKVVVAGLLVGFGTRLGSGCTSGHGVCGIARLAKRSFVATLVFIGFGVITVALQGVLK